MNLYDYHVNSNALYGYNNRENIPSIFWEIHQYDDDDELVKYENIIAQDANASVSYASVYLNAPFEKGEDIIAKSALFSNSYALNVLHGPFPKGEDIISKNANFSFLYATETLKGRFQLGEKIMKTDPDIWKAYIKKYGDNI